MREDMTKLTVAFRYLSERSLKLLIICSWPVRHGSARDKTHLTMLFLNMLNSADAILRSCAALTWFCVCCVLFQWPLTASSVTVKDRQRRRRNVRPADVLCLRSHIWETAKTSRPELQPLLRCGTRAHGSRGLCLWLIWQSYFLFTSNRPVRTTSLIQHPFPWIIHVDCSVFGLRSSYTTW